MNSNIQSIHVRRQGVAGTILRLGRIAGSTAAICLAASLLSLSVGNAADTLDPTGKTIRLGDKSVETAVRTDERYGRDGIFEGPRGWAYWNYLSHPKDIQNPNLWPDMQSTYFIGQMALPAGAELTLHSSFPRARYFQFAMYVSKNNTFVSIGEDLTGPQIQPDAGSVNPFVPGNPRDSENRDFTIVVRAEEAPKNAAERPPNTMYVGSSGGLIQGVLRIYLGDEGQDGAGWADGTTTVMTTGFPTYEGKLANGEKLTQAQVVAQFGQPINGGIAQPLTADQWVALVNSPKNDPTLDPKSSPARPGGEWQKYWTFGYSIVGGFKTAEELAKVTFEGAIDGGGDPNTQYLLATLSREFGPVYVLKGKMPTFPDTFLGADGVGLATMPDTQVQYFSIVSAEAAPSGRIVDGLADMQIPLDDDGNYTIAYSRREDRPSNATAENGVAWIEWSAKGEGLDSPQNRENFGMLMIRMMDPASDWIESPKNVTKPGTEAEVMGPYFPRGEYMDKAGFEALGSMK